MGKAVPKNVKTRAGILLQVKPELFGAEFEKNKQALGTLGIPFSKTVRNLVTGYITREVKKKANKEKRQQAAKKPVVA
ncbi:MAG: 30S ribosomal protein S17e [Candidatus Diapherotrites archaeon]|uniref:30S ribosomal protein S17e n=1 Tax=Candidatus Iainarchaeum sp. TaxID=3101447 RepID=A0A7J4KV80_9ARCH|nr:MAG: 30S ribosomal protein S17, small subunit ribosomal protein S17e [archaeon GW2011_AR21]MBS3058679.1 30S ribosomal protein S17e [Candidatus Diapherotrites archaeon]HIH21875.1 30S ribosomal protein S17e [Candidatus Diapherotrites archaeon]HIH33594.1 30S ribosomal protein S17e [Candidatus Diapherotrites archaeon]